MPVCLICGDVRSEGGDGDYHRACLERLWGSAEPPRVPWTRKTLAAEVEAGDSSSISGFQSKALIRVGPGQTLEVPDTGSTHILKPQADQLPHMPENEHLSMRLAELAGLEVPPCGLVRLADGSFAYVVRRFDRIAGDPPRRLQKQDFCQLLDLQPTQMFDEPTEACARAVREYADMLVDPAGVLVRLFRLVIVAFWLGNGDMHLKNISLLEDVADPRRYRLSPAYDFLCTALYGARHRSMALTIGGRKIAAELRLRHFLALAEEAFALPAAQAREVIAEVAGQEAEAGERLARSLLPNKLRREYVRVVAARTAALRDERP